MKRLLIFLMLFAFVFSLQAQSAKSEILKSNKHQGLKTDGIVQPYLNDFLEQCKKYNIDFHDKLFKLKEIAVVDSLQVNTKGGTLGLLVRDENKEVEKIVFSWMTLLDKEILKVVAFHEFGHYFLGYKHTCGDCNVIMAEVNTSYFDIVKDWEHQVEKLFIESPEYNKKVNYYAEN